MWCFCMVGALWKNTCISDIMFVRITGPRSARQRPGDISSDDSSSDSDRSDDAPQRAPNIQMNAKTKAIALGWLRQVRGRR
jgi:hypothetical protein